jgi:hypothetical protein
MVEAQLAPADRLLEMQRTQMESAHRDKDREQAKVVAADKKATEAA